MHGRGRVLACTWLPELHRRRRAWLRLPDDQRGHVPGLLGQAAGAHGGARQQREEAGAVPGLAVPQLGLDAVEEDMNHKGRNKV